MKDGFIKVASACPEVKVADTVYNTESIISVLKEAEDMGVKLAVFPELAVTGCTAGDLLFTDTLVKGAAAGIEKIVKATDGTEIIAVVGSPVKAYGKLYNCAVVIYGGEILGVVPKCVAQGKEEARWFADGKDTEGVIELCGAVVPFGPDIVFRNTELEEFSFAAEIGAEGRSIQSLSRSGAVIIAGLGGSSYLAGAAKRIKKSVEVLTANNICGYIYTSPGAGESTTDGSYAGYRVISERGKTLAEDLPFAESVLTVTEIDVKVLCDLRLRDSGYLPYRGDNEVCFSMSCVETLLTRIYGLSPFVPEDRDEAAERFAEIISIAANGLKKRISHVSAKGAVVAVSGGLDSTLALLITVRAIDLLGLDRKSITAVSMPGFGTTVRTKSNAEKLCDSLGVSYREVDITEAVRVHFRDIGHSEDVHDVTYENSQARERTQIAMDIANKEGAILVGTGDLSELALGWATYNGDHMSMYGVNGGIPKTLMRHIVSFCADNGGEVLGGILRDILDTPVSPELLPAKDGKISQCTEDIVGPYQLHDFFIYYFIRYGMSPAKLFRIACYTFDGEYSPVEIFKWQKNFTRRFFAQQFKRSCLPDGPRVGSIGISPRGAFKMPSDALSSVWMSELDEIEKTL